LHDKSEVVATAKATFHLPLDAVLSSRQKVIARGYRSVL